MTEMKREGTGVKPPLSYILDFGPALDHVAEVMNRGHILRGYERNNWKGGGKNATLDVLLDSVMRHLRARQCGEVYDPYDKKGIGTDHLANGCAGLLFALYHHGKDALPLPDSTKVEDGRPFYPKVGRRK
jgi:hypothetical protein